MNMNNSNDVTEVVIVRGVAVNLADVSPALRLQYHAASRAVGRHDRARDQLQAVGEKILAEQAPNIASKAFAAVHKRSRVNGRVALAKLMGLPPSK
jgi:hypothetical protein